MFLLVGEEEGTNCRCEGLPKFVHHSRNGKRKQYNLFYMKGGVFKNYLMYNSIDSCSMLVLRKNMIKA